ncbi:hypothetical protein B14_200169 (plasmid) [Bacillus licheniformis]|uniref:hypothetical protein n=1 Tax=Bacillus licheniformis TaxID=1402 RepID=UPI0009B758A7|nr:hypothetical protein [Bacillus licheniformis]ARC67380.1 hypothetical protein B14_200169 [Bacillus licheniformis]ARW46211.1 hypothetical protein S100141_04993 [Bacillus licheniformis]MDE1421811.1 hypothetical protein [Bacillus licheniformis]MEC0475816.1 hypothetical protein [Bacillus licheniformis]RHL11878.1 hypothetical protein DW032_19805 [Bacillus licheniformis]
MRLLSQIIDDLVSGERPSHEECYKALLVYRFMLNIDHRLYREELMKEKRDPEWIRKKKAETSFNMYKGALSSSPNEWLGRR